ncbi:hypothetical protein [Pseudomonas sp. TWP3-1]|uniref:hypothetical protein n=1 Tax=Pseudomonas sp. TWP3-1 TaxID=2804631 RepID=UPI003CF07803
MTVTFFFGIPWIGLDAAGEPNLPDFAEHVWRGVIAVTGDKRGGIHFFAEENSMVKRRVFSAKNRLF